MATIESLDLATLTNNPQSIAEALEDALEVSSGNLGTLKQTAENNANQITNTLLPQAQADASAIAQLNTQAGITAKYYTSLSGSFSTFNAHSGTTAEEGIRLINQGLLWICHCSIYLDVPTGYGEEIIHDLGSDFTAPTNTVILGHSHFSPGTQHDYTANLRITSANQLRVYYNNNGNTGFVLYGSYSGIDTSY